MTLWFHDSQSALVTTSLLPSLTMNSHLPKSWTELIFSTSPGGMVSGAGAQRALLPAAAPTLHKHLREAHPRVGSEGFGEAGMSCAGDHQQPGAESLPVLPSVAFPTKHIRHMGQNHPLTVGLPHSAEQREGLWGPLCQEIIEKRNSRQWWQSQETFTPHCHSSWCGPFGSVANMPGKGAGSTQYTVRNIWGCWSVWSKNSAFSHTFLESTKICQFTNIYTKKPKSYSSRAPPAVRSFSYFLPFLCVWFLVWIHVY